MTNLDPVIETIQRSQKMLFMLCGLPYAGKSYIAQELMKTGNVNYVSIDDIFHRYGFDWTAGKLPNGAEWRAIFEESYAKTKDALSRDENVLYDSTNHTFESREKLRDVAVANQAKSFVIFIDVSTQIIWKRWEESMKNKNRPVVDRSLVEQTIATMEKPRLSENVICITND